MLLLNLDIHWVLLTFGVYTLISFVLIKNWLDRTKTERAHGGDVIYTYGKHA